MNVKKEKGICAYILQHSTKEPVVREVCALIFFVLLL